MTDKNPLLDITEKFPFDRVKPEHLEPGVAAVLDEARAVQEEVIGVQGQRTFENTLLGIERISEKPLFVYNILEHINAVDNSEAFSREFEKVQGPIHEFLAGISRSEGLWKAVSSYAGSDEAKNLTGARKRFLEVTIREFRKAGADLPADKKEKLTDIDIELAKLTVKFSQNVLDATKAFELVITDPKQLAGLPEIAVEQAKAAAEKKNIQGWRFTLQAPSYIAVMTYMDDAAVREQVYRAYNSRAASGETDNSGLIERILTLRKEKAELLGFKNFADFILQDRMAKTGERASRFLQDLTGKVSGKFGEETKSLQEFRDTLEGSATGPLKPWDMAYYAEKQRRQLYDFDEEELRPYFPYGKVLAGMFDVARRLYGIDVREISGFPVWDSGVKTYAVHDEDGTVLGTFYTDFFPRESKRGGAWMNCFIPGCSVPGGFNPHHGFIAGNFTPPVGGKPSLLTHNEVETTFHEFGHLLHQLLSRVAVKSLAGTNVAWDFVELPSQIMENWCWEREALDMFAAHYESGAVIPDQLFTRMIKARNFRAASRFMRQISFAAMDLALHTEYDPGKHGNVVAYARRLSQEYSAVPLEEDYSMVTGFTHLFSDPVGYAAGYYSYHWAEVLDADAFTRFRTEGIFNSETAKSFRREILAAGNTAEAEELYRNFMGRGPDSEALLKRAGITD